MYHLMSLLIPRALRSGAIINGSLNARLSGLIVLPVALLTLLGAACAAAATPVPSSEATAVPSPTPTSASKIKVVATTTVLADMARNVGGNLVEVTSIVPPGVDVHSFQTTPSHSLAVGNAKLIVSNGFGLDNSFDPLLTNNMQAGAVRIVASEGLNAAALEEMEFPVGDDGNEPNDGDLVEQAAQIIHRSEEGEISAEIALEQIEALLSRHQGEGTVPAVEEHGDQDKILGEGLMELVHEAEEGHMTPESAIEAMEQLMQQYEGDGHQDEDERGHGHEAGDPHFWQDPTLAIHYVERIRDGFKEVDPTNAEIYDGNAAEYIEKLRDLDQEIAQTLDQVPPERRHLVTFHDAFGYFARRYGWKVSAFVPGDASDVTPGAVIQVMERVRAEGIPAVFAEPQFGTGVLEQAARDTGVRVGVIYSDTIDEKVPGYIEMMRSNAKSLAENLS